MKINLSESILNELDRSNIMSDSDVKFIINSFSEKHNNIGYKIEGNEAIFEDGTIIKFVVNDDSEIEYYFINNQGDASKSVPVYDSSLLELTESLKEDTDWSKQLDYTIIESNTKEICEALENYFKNAGYDVLKVKYADMWMFEVQVYLSKPNFGEIDVYLDTRFSKFEFGHVKLKDRNTIDNECLKGLNSLVQISNDINNSINLLDLIK